MKKIFYILISVLLIVVYGFLSGNKNNSINKTAINDNYNYISVNEVMMWVSNNGDGSYDPRTDYAGFYWPGGENATKTAVFEDGLIWGGIVDTEIRVNGNIYRQGLQAGKILADGTPDDPSLEKYRVFKINKYWQQLPPGPKRNKLEKDYNEWPVEDGAPWIDINGDGIFTRGIDKPQFLGDETLWYVSNDMDSSRSVSTFGSLPIGLELQTTIYAFNRTNLLENAVFKKYKIINKGNYTVKDMYFGYWSDGDLGYYYDDYAGSDTTLNLGYYYNGDNEDGNGLGQTYGTAPPALGYVLLKGPKDFGKSEMHNSLEMTAFIIWFYFWNSLPPAPFTENDYYNFLKGLVWDGSNFIDPITGNPTKFLLPGDPVNGTGWYEGEGWSGAPPPSDRRALLSSGPFNFAPGDTQEVVIGILISRGESNIQSVAELKIDAKALQTFYDLYKPEIPEPIIEVPKYYSIEQNYPNPFNPTTKIQYSIPVASLVTLKVYDILGNEISTLVNEEQEADEYTVEFNADGLSSGIYLYTISAKDFTRTKKMILLR